MERIVVASSNKGKVREVQEILSEYNVVSINEIGVNIDVEEDKPTFKENAIKKAEEMARYTNVKCLADDSGIEVEYLDGFPGVYTKRWFKGSDRERNLQLIEKLKGVEREKRRVKFTSAIALSDGLKIISVEASIDGFIASEPRGENGFGFDEIFELDNGKTLAELTDSEKNQISARRIALNKLKKELESKKL